MQDLMEYIELEMQWAESMKELPKTDMNWLEIFPESKPLVRANIVKRLKLLQQIEKQKYGELQEAKNKANSLPPHQQAPWDKLVEQIEHYISKNQTEVRSLKWQKDKLDGKERVYNSGITDEEKDIARTIPIMNFVECKRTGNNYVTLCIFHSDTKPSLTIFRDNRYKCFACNAFGDSIDFIMKLNGLSFIEAVKFLINK